MQQDLQRMFISNVLRLFNVLIVDVVVAVSFVVCFSSLMSPKEVTTRLQLLETTKS